MALPNNLSSYSTLQANYDRLAGVQPTTALRGPTDYDPIQYSQPTQNLRQGRDIININTQGDQTSAQRVQNQANRIAERQAAQSLGAIQSIGMTQAALDPIRQNYISNYKLTDQERANVNRLTGQGYSPGFAFNNRGTQLTANANQSTGAGFQNNYDQYNNSTNAFRTAAGYPPTNSLEQSYQRLLGRIQVYC